MKTLYDKYYIPQANISADISNTIKSIYEKYSEYNPIEIQSIIVGYSSLEKAYMITHWRLDKMKDNKNEIL